MEPCSEETTAYMDDATASPAAGESRLATMPTLQRRLSFPFTRSASVDGPSAPSTTLSLEEELKAQRYEQMMDRFQLRHVPLRRTASDLSAASGEKTQFPSRRHSMDRVPATVLKTVTDRPPSKRLSGSIHAATSIADGPTISMSWEHSPLDHRVVHLWQPFHPTGRCTRVRMVVLVTIFVMQLIYMPYGIVYYPANHSVAITLDVMIDLVFVLNIVAISNTEVHVSRGPPITSRRAIWRYHRKRGFWLDVLAAFPIEMPLHVFIVPTHSWVCWTLRVPHLVLQYTSLAWHVNRFHRAWQREVIRTDKSLIAWMLYSRYSHLVRIGAIVVLVTIMAHYFACIWTLLQANVDPTFLSSNDPLTIHIHSIYDALQLLQGQGLPTTTPTQDLFASVAVLLGSIALAVIFGHVAILVSNFSANETSYQRKMERVFAIMGKLQLPHPIRERVHQYYEYLHTEYESLDGEIVKFAKELSHTLELEVVLFKYMDVIMHVPHWRECSPSFQKQLVLNLSIRVYLPDDFIMRRGEVGTECYIINRGTCKQYEYVTGNSEPPTMAMVSLNPESRSRPQVSHWNTKVWAFAPPQTADPGENESYSSVNLLTRGQAIGGMALIANYKRSSDISAVSYVEMCVIERETFQQILARYPRDREIVLMSIVQHTMMHFASERTPCPLMRQIHQVAPDVSVSTGIQAIANVINPCESDSTIVYGVTEQLTTRLQTFFGTGTTEASAVATPPDTHTVARPKYVPREASPLENELFLMIKDIQQRLSRLEEAKLQSQNEYQQPCCRYHRTKSPKHQSPASPKDPAPFYRSRRQTTTAVNLGRPRDRHDTTTEAPSIQEDTSIARDKSSTDLSPPLSTPFQLLEDIMGAIWPRSPPERSPSPYTDELFRTRSFRSNESPVELRDITSNRFMSVPKM